jgi:hypothetical protein
MSSDDKSREEIEGEANVVRSKLMHTVEELDRRRHEALNLGHQLRSHGVKLAIVGGIVVLATASVMGLVAGQMAVVWDRRRRSGWRLPSRPVYRERRPFFVDLIRSAALMVITTALSVPARRLASKLSASVPPKPGRHGVADAPR